jgi:hypothetical protein
VFSLTTTMLEHKHHLLTTNDAPSSIVAAFFSQKLKDINDQIAKLQQARQNCLIVLAPIQHLPLEILSAIFTETLSPEEGPPEDVMQITSCLISVCRTW